MKKFVTVFVLLCAHISLFAQTKESSKKSDDPLDISIQLEQINKYGVPTIAAVEAMKNKADVLYEAKSWEEAAKAYEVYAKNVNWLANLLAQCVEPYYSAGYDDKKSISYSTLKPFIPFESKSNECKKNRNIAYIKMGLCYKNIADVKNAVVYLHKGLDLLSVDELEYWTLAKNAMAEILQFEPSK